MNFSKNDERGLIDVTTHTETNGDLFLSTLYSDADTDLDTGGD